MLEEKLYDADYVKRCTDLPLLVRMDTLRAAAGARRCSRLPRPATLDQQTRVLEAGEKEPPPLAQTEHAHPARRCARNGATTSSWDATRDGAAGGHPRRGGRALRRARLDAAAGGRRSTVTLADGSTVDAAGRCSTSSQRVRWTHLRLRRRSRSSPGPRRTRVRVAGPAHRRRTGHDALRDRHGAQPVLQQRPQGPRTSSCWRR